MLITVATTGRPLTPCSHGEGDDDPPCDLATIACFEADTHGGTASAAVNPILARIGDLSTSHLLCRSGDFQVPGQQRMTSCEVLAYRNSGAFKDERGGAITVFAVTVFDHAMGVHHVMAFSNEADAMRTFGLHAL